MKHKKNFIIVLVLFLSLNIIIISSFILVKKNENNSKIDTNIKYELSATITTSKELETEKISLVFKNDNSTTRITSSKNHIKGFIINDKIRYKDNSIIYSYKLKDNYIDPLKSLPNLSKADEIDRRSDYISYTKVLNAKQINNILDSLFFKEKTNLDVLIKFSKRNDKISTLNFTLADIPGYKKIDVMLKFKELNEDFKVNTKEIENMNNLEEGPLHFYEHKVTKENIFEIVK